MNIYLSFIQILALIFVLVILRVYVYRIKYFAQVFQQVGYKNNEFWLWMRSNWDDKVLPTELGVYNLVIFGSILLNDWFSLNLTDTSLALILLTIGLFWLSSVKRYKAEKVKKPLVFTDRVKRFFVPYLILSISFPAFLSYLAFPVTTISLLPFDSQLLTFGLVFGLILIPFWILLAGLITKPIEKFIQEGFKKQARKKLASMPHLKIVAITGSYGKTSVKFMIRDLLKERFSVCSTPGSFNTPMGICKVINNDLQAHHQILILEMGARYAGNIQELCDIAQPHISVVTNVGLAHLETFGSQDVIAREKGTIVDNLRSGGVAVLNSDDLRVNKMGANRADISKILVGLESAQITGRNITYNTEGTSFEITSEDNSESFSVGLLGTHNVQNLLLAVGVAHHFGIRLKTMAIGAKNIEPIEHRLELKKAGSIFIIDDAFNSNPVGAKNAVEILAQFNSGRRVIITPGMVELGDREWEENKIFGNHIGKANLDLILLVGEERAKPIFEGIKEIDGQEEKVQIVKTLFEANEVMRAFVQSGDIVLYENDLPDVYNEG